MRIIEKINVCLYDNRYLIPKDWDISMTNAQQMSHIALHCHLF